MREACDSEVFRTRCSGPHVMKAEPASQAPSRLSVSLMENPVQVPFSLVILEIIAYSWENIGILRPHRINGPINSESRSEAWRPGNGFGCVGLSAHIRRRHCGLTHAVQTECCDGRGQLCPSRCRSHPSRAGRSCPQWRTRPQLHRHVAAGHLWPLSEHTECAQ